MELRVDDLSKCISEATIEPKCQSFAKSILRKKKIDLESIGTKNNNLLVDFLRCQSKSRKHCTNVEKEYAKCHGSVMGTGSFQGKKNCGEELEKLLNCALKS
jgi:hypothetical protein